jgi:hypothetical protein
MSVGVMKDYKLKLGSYAPRIHWVGRGTGTPVGDIDIIGRGMTASG